MKHSFISILLLAFSFSALRAQAQPPKLILSIVVDELDNDHLLLLQSSFSERGINRLSCEGFRFMAATSSDFSGYPGTRITSLYSGVTPSEHGIIGEQWYDYRGNRFTDPVSFNNKHSLYEAVRNNMSRTVGDYLKSFFGSEAGVAALSVNAPWMVHTVGYTSDSFYAFDEETGAFRNALNNDSAVWVNEFNSRYSTAGYLSRQWGPVKDITAYVEYRYKSDDERARFRSFLYDMNDEGSFRRIAGSPYVNTLLRDFTVAFLVNSGFGSDNVPDMLSICFTTRPFTETNGTILPVEKEDMLLRLDAEIASLIDFLDIEYGRNNYLIMLTSGAAGALDQSTSGRQGVSSGYFDGTKTMALLNLYLMAVHGQGKWVNGYCDGTIYLNRQLIEQENLSLKEFQEEVARFMLEVAGITKAVPTYDFFLNTHCDAGIAKNMFTKRTGDVYLSLLPGWQTPVSTLGSRQNGTSGAQPVPFIFFGWKTAAGKAWQENVDINTMIPLLMKEIGLSHPKISQVKETPCFIN
ncbi:MAG: alkaline phosphatase family protein [Cytophagaceae bacterium]|jgi:hypothetical protein|nr:alkaline phosphatase family protein [Cytophagaceae bacterium]